MRVTREAGITVPLTTVDQPLDSMLRDGSLPGLHKTASFGSRAAERLKTLRANQHTGPLMCAEFWDGWFDWWGGVHHTTDAAAVAAGAAEAAEAATQAELAEIGAEAEATLRRLYEGHVLDDAFLAEGAAMLQRMREEGTLLGTPRNV